MVCFKNYIFGEINVLAKSLLVYAEKTLKILVNIFSVLLAPFWVWILIWVLLVPNFYKSRNKFRDTLIISTCFLWGAPWLWCNILFGPDKRKLLFGREGLWG